MSNAITLNVNDILSSEERHEICREAFADAAKKAARADLERMLSNAAYRLVFEAVDKEMDGQAQSLIKEKSLQVIANLSAFTVFREADAWEREAAVGRKILTQAVIDAKPVIMAKVEEIVRGLDADFLGARLNDVIYQVITDKLGVGQK